jgi:hydrogenase maturation protease
LNGKDPKVVVVVGVGNRALSDEGIGCRIAREVSPRLPSWVEVVDDGLPGPRLLEILKGRKMAVIVDAVDAHGPPGTVYRFCADELIPSRPVSRCSLHEGDILLYVQLARATGTCPDEVLVVGVQPEALLPGESLSPAVERAVSTAADLIVAEVLHCSPVAPEKISTKNKETIHAD